MAVTILAYYAASVFKLPNFIVNLLLILHKHENGLKDSIFPLCFAYILGPQNAIIDAASLCADIFLIFSFFQLHDHSSRCSCYLCGLFSITFTFFPLTSKILVVFVVIFHVKPFKTP